MINTDSLLTVVVFEHAEGEPVAFLQWLWLSERAQVESLGKWFGQFHLLSKKFALEFPDICKRARKWDQLHDSILSGAPIDQQDLDSVSDPSKFGLIHGDVNVSNYFVNPITRVPHMFDWDQSQLSWFLHDLAGPVWAVVALKQSGNPIDNSPVPEANVELFTDWLLSGYESVEGIEAVDRVALHRMVNLRRLLYKRFSAKAILELPPDSPMYKFFFFVNTWLSKE